MEEKIISIPLQQRNNNYYINVRTNDSDDDDDNVTRDDSLRKAISDAALSGKLKLSNYSLIQCPLEVWQCSNLVHLDLSANSLKRIGKEVGLLSSLKYFSVNHNLLSKLPRELWLILSHYLSLSLSLYLIYEIGKSQH